MKRLATMQTSLLIAAPLWLIWSICYLEETSDEIGYYKDPHAISMGLRANESKLREIYTNQMSVVVSGLSLKAC